MRFGQTLDRAVYRPWQDYYIDYRKLKKLLREDEPSSSSATGRPDDSWTDEDAEKFYAELTNVQLEKVQNFHKETYQKLRDRTSKCEAKLDPIAASVKGENGTPSLDSQVNGNGNGKKPSPSDEEKTRIMKEVAEELDSITREVNELEKYSRINYTGFLKIAKKHDRKRGGRVSVRSPLQSLLAKVPFNKEDYSPLLYRISAMYSFVRQQLEGRDVGAGVTETQSGGETYRSQKFFVHPDNLLEVKTIILRRLPVLVYNPQTSKIAQAGQRDPRITSIYFDNPNFVLYNAKVEHQVPASSLRLRWYDRLSENPDIYCEKKTVKDDDTSEEQRFNIKEKYVQSFIEGEYGMDKQIQKLKSRSGEDSAQAKSYQTSVKTVQDFITEHELQPALRASYTRTAFQIPGDNSVRISLDTNLAFIREDAIDTDRPCRDPEDWHRRDIDDAGLEYPYKSIRKGEISRFPYVLLEIKTKGPEEHEWINDLTNSHLVKQASRFSKFVHGVASLFEDQVNAFPFWLSAMEEDIRQDPEDAYKEEQAKKQKQTDDETAVGSFISKTKTPPSRPTALSPVGSPSAKPTPPDFRRRSQGSHHSQQSHHSQTAKAAPTGVEDIAEEADSDDDGPQAHDTEEPRPHHAGLGSLFPSFSTSKYARRRRGADAPLPPGVRKPDYWIKDEGAVKVEAKVWLANQRTFIKWQHVSVLLASLSLGLYNAAGADNNIARALAVVYTVLALFIGVWGWGVYVWRSRLIERRSGKDFDAITGPIIVCLGLGFALLLNFGFKYHEARQNRRTTTFDMPSVNTSDGLPMMGMGEL